MAIQLPKKYLDEARIKHGQIVDTYFARKFGALIVQPVGRFGPLTSLSEMWSTLEGAFTYYFTYTNPVDYENDLKSILGPAEFRVAVFFTGPILNELISSDIDRVAKRFIEVLLENKKARFEVVADKPESDELRKRIAETKLESDITDRIDVQDLPPMLSSRWGISPDKDRGYISPSGNNRSYDSVLNLEPSYIIVDNTSVLFSFDRFWPIFQSPSSAFFYTRGQESLVQRFVDHFRRLRLLARKIVESNPTLT